MLATRTGLKPAKHHLLEVSVAETNDAAEPLPSLVPSVKANSETNAK